MSREIPPIKWVVPDYVPEGLSVLAGRQKLGKTWLAMDLAIAVASGGVALGSIPCEQGDVLYIDFENGPRRVQRRLEALGTNKIDLSRLEWSHDAPPLNEGFVEALDDWRTSVSKPRLVVVDVLQRIKPRGGGNLNAYERDYGVMAGLQRWATDHGIAVVVLHHTRKGGAEDPLEALSGSNGLSACADTTLLLDKKGDSLTLYVRGRDVEEKESALRFTSGIWNLIGDAAEIRRTGERQALLNALLAADDSMTPGELSVAVNMSRNNVDQLLFKMHKAGEVQKAGRGRYTHPSRTDVATASPYPDKFDKKVEAR